MRMNSLIAALVFAACSTASHAAADKSPGDTPKLSAIMNAADAVTRSEAQTELFELVATAENGQLTVFIDRFVSNEPVTGAKVEVESGSWKAVLPATDNGSYRVNAPQFAKPGRYPLLFTVEAGTDADLIETMLVVAEAAKSEATVNLWSSGLMWWWVGGGLAVLAALVTISRLLNRRRPGRSA